MMRAGEITGLYEEGADADAGRTRVTFRSAKSRRHTSGRPEPARSKPRVDGRSPRIFPWPAGTEPSSKAAANRRDKEVSNQRE